MTNLAFIVAAIVVWPKAREASLGPALCVVLAMIGIGSGLFHTFATPWAAAVDVAPILGFVLIYLYGVFREIFGRPAWQAWLGVIGFFPYAVVARAGFTQFAFLGSSASYMPIPLGLLIIAAFLCNRAPETAKAIVIGVLILLVSITFRILDEPLCANLPIGTHFLWHVLNALMLGWMILVYARSPKV